MSPIRRRALRALAAAALVTAMPPAALARISPRNEDLCRGRKPVGPLTMFYSVPVPHAPVGTPLDVALLYEQNGMAKLREEAKEAFRLQPPPALARAMDSYTFLTPESEKDTYGMGDLVAMTQISMALKYRTQLWRHFLEAFATVKEAPSEDPYVTRFEVSLDLTYFCRYRQRIQDLVTKR